MEHLADLQHGCLLEISKLLVERMQHRGPPGIFLCVGLHVFEESFKKDFTFSNPNHALAGPPPHYPPMDEFWYTVSTGMDSQEFAKDTQVAVPLFPNMHSTEVSCGYACMSHA